MVRLDIRLLGTMELSVPGESIDTLSAKKPRALLAYLAMHAGQRISRDKVAALLWSDQADEFARTNLRQSLSVLRKAIRYDEAEVISNAGGSMLVADSAQLRLDVFEFEALCESKKPSHFDDIQRLYRGHFLQDFTINEPGFEQWQYTERRKLEHLHARYLSDVLKHADLKHDFDKQVSVGKALLAIEPLDEATHRTVINAHRELENPAAAMEQYELCHELLKNELGLAPELQTSTLVSDLRPRRINSKAPGSANSPLLVQVSAEQPEVHDLFVSDTGVDQQQEVAEQRLSKKFTGRRFVLALTAIVSVGLVSVIYVLTRNPENTLNKVSVQTLPASQGSIMTSTDTESATKKPLLAVLPITNMNSGDDFSYFSDGLTEDLITELSRLSAISVLSSTTSFAYQDTDQPISRIAEELSADYLLEGSVRLNGSRIRANFKLIDTDKGTYEWAKKFDHKMSDIFEFQDEIVGDVIETLSLSLTDTETEYLSNTRDINPEAYNLLLRGLSPLREFSELGIAEARQYFEQALIIQPDYARAHANLALSYGREVVFRLADFQLEIINKGLEEAKKAEELDNTIPQTEFARGVLYLAARDHAAAVKASRRAIELDSNYADGYAVLAQTSAYAGNLEEALIAIRKAKALDRMHPFSYLWVEGHILYQLGRYDEAVKPLETVIERNPTFLLGIMTLSAAYGQLGRFDDAEWQNHEILTVTPSFSAHDEAMKAPYRQSKHRERYLDGLLKAGLPE